MKKLTLLIVALATSIAFSVYAITQKNQEPKKISTIVFTSFVDGPPDLKSVLEAQVDNYNLKGYRLSTTELVNVPPKDGSGDPQRIMLCATFERITDGN